MKADTAKNAFERLPGGTETVLVVDDDNNVRALIRETLKLKGYQVLDAQFNSGALMVSGRHRGTLHLMIADVMMPGINGRELGRRLESLRPDMKILYVSGYPREILLDEKILEERSAFLQKPLSPETLLPKVREILDSSEPAPHTDSENDEFVLNMLQSLLNRKKNSTSRKSRAPSWKRCWSNMKKHGWPVKRSLWSPSCTSKHWPKTIAFPRTSKPPCGILNVRRLRCV